MSNAPIAGAMSLEEFSQKAQIVMREVKKVIVGQDELIRNVMICVVAGRHALLEGVPGLGKTMLIRTLADVMDLQFNRIQFTPDMMPADITGTNIMQVEENGHRELSFQPGPIFSNMVLADEINRATPKTQSALLEAMQEKRVTIANTTYHLDKPFFVLATQNPLEMEGTYPLPEAQLDRFMLKLDVPFPSAQDLMEIFNRTTASYEDDVHAVVNGEEIVAMGQIALGVPMPSSVNEYVARIVVATHPDSADATDKVRRYVRYGSSPRGGQSIIMGAKVNALLDGRYNVSYADIAAIAPSALRHRLLLNFEGQAEGITADDIIAELLEQLPK